MKLRRKISGVLIACLSLVGVAIAASPASAGGAPPYFKDECNSSVSPTGIRSYDLDQPAKGNNLDSGECRNDLGAFGDYIYVPQVRVDVNPELFLGGGVDVDSYVPGEIGVGYDVCRENSENSEANPVNDWADNGFRYKTYTNGNCSGNY